MEKDFFDPVFQTLLAKINKLKDDPEYKELLQTLYKAGAAYSLPSTFASEA